MLGEPIILEQLKKEGKLTTPQSQVAYKQYQTVFQNMKNIVGELQEELYASKDQDITDDGFNLSTDDTIGECLDVQSECYKNLLTEFPGVSKCFNSSSNDYRGRSQIFFEGLNEKSANSIFAQELYGIKQSLFKLIGNVKLYKGNKISKDLNQKILSELEPGDIAATGKEGALTNALFAGYWTHGIIYIGNEHQWKKKFNKEPEVSNHYKKECEKFRLPCNNFVGYLKSRYPKNYKRFLENPEFNVVESLAEGVIFSSGKKSLRTNRLATLRPKNLSPLDKAKAVEKAFSVVGRPYDYNFDGRTDYALVCTEVIEQAYRGKVKFKQDVILGKPVMQAENLVDLAVNSPDKLELIHYADSTQNKTQFLDHSKIRVQ
jgi:hypothetical protein